MYALSACMLFVCESVEKDLNSYTEMLEPPPPQHTHSIWNIFAFINNIYLQAPTPDYKYLKTCTDPEFFLE